MMRYVSVRAHFGFGVPESGDGLFAPRRYDRRTLTTATHMSVPPRLAGKLNETLGPDAAGDLVMWLDEMRAEHLEMREAVRADFAEMRQEMLAMEMRLREGSTSELHALEARLGQRFDALGERIHTVDNKVDQRHAELMRWSFVFWVGAVTAIAALAGVLRS